jgi:hypothetical protein
MPESDDRVALRVLRGLPAREREAMIRFYLDGNTPEQIQVALGLSEADFLRIRKCSKDQFLLLRRCGAGKSSASSAVPSQRREVA